MNRKVQNAVISKLIEDLSILRELGKNNKPDKKRIENALKCMNYISSYSMTNNKAVCFYYFSMKKALVITGKTLHDLRKHKVHEITAYEKLRCLNFMNLPIPKELSNAVIAQELDTEEDDCMFLDNLLKDNLDGDFDDYALYIGYTFGKLNK